MKRLLERIIPIALLFLFGLFSPHAAFSASEVNIGLIMPLTGRVAAIGIDTLHGAEIAAKEINDAGGLEVAGKKYKVVIRSYDDEANPAKAIAGMQRLKDKYNVPVIINGMSASTMAMLEQNERLGIIIMGYFKHPDATKRGNKLVLRHQQTNLDDAKQLAEAVNKVLKPKTYAMISDTSDYGKVSVKGYEDTFTQLGVKQVANEWCDGRTQTDFRGQLTKIRGANPDVIMLTAYDEPSAGVVKQAHELGIKTPFVLSTGFGTTAEALTGPDLIEGYFKRIEFTSKTPWPPANARYRDELYPAMEYKEPIAGFGINTYATVHIITSAMQKAGTTTDAYKIREAVQHVVPLPEKYDTTGLLKFFENGAAEMFADVGRFHNGKLIPIE